MEITHKDWDPLFIRYLLKTKGTNLAKIAEKYKYNRKSISRALYIPWPAIEFIIAREIGKEPWEIWPSRYNEKHEHVNGPVKYLSTNGRFINV